MTATVKGGPVVWGGSRDDEGFREFTVSHLVRTTSVNDGPYTVMNASGLPLIGSMWNFGNDLDLWAFCFPEMKVELHQHKEGDPHYWWKVSQKFSTKPISRCQDTNVEDPLSEPQKVSGNFNKYTIEAVYDRHGNMIKSSSHEQIRGRQVEFDNNKPTVVIQQNVANLGLSTFAQMIDTVNDGPMWGLPARCVKLSNAPWERKYYARCHVYYTRTFEFDVDYDTFDRTALDEGTKVLHGHWSGNAGTGLTVKVATVSSTGGILTVTLFSGGTGYTPSSTFQVVVIQTGGLYGVLKATTNSGGVVTSVSVTAAGIGYTVDNPSDPLDFSTTSTESSWILDQIAGNDPDPDNPSHFIRFKDRNGENTRTVLNGRGCPVTAASQAGIVDVSYYGSSNFFTLGIPVNF